MKLRAGSAIVSLLAIAAYAQSENNSAANSRSPGAPGTDLKKWADAREYELGLQVSRASNPDEQLKLLNEWETVYPKSEFEQERTAWFVTVYRSAGRPAEAFGRATQLYKLHPKEISGPYTIASLAPLLTSPSAEQIELAKEVAGNLLARAPELGRAAAALEEAARDNTRPEASGLDTDGVTAMLREWRRGKRIRTPADVESEARQVAEKALAWVSKVSQP